jgi:hypothetical protein
MNDFSDGRGTRGGRSPRPRTTTEQWKEVNGVLIPAVLPEKAGLGCPKCDDHVLVPFTSIQGGSHPEVMAFVKKHIDCGPFDTLEVHQGRVVLTGQLKDPES